MNIFEKNKEKADNFNRYFNVIKNLGIIFSAIASFISKVVSLNFIRTTLISDFPQLKNIIDNLISAHNFLIGTLIILLLYSFFRFIYNALMSSVKGRQAVSSFARMIHINFIHDIRSNIVELDTLSEKLNNIDLENANIDKIYNEELEKLRNNIQPYVDILAEYLSSYRNDTISVCVKIMKDGNRYNSDYLDKELITLARSKNTKTYRKTSRNSIIRNNSDFIELSLGKSMFYGKCNLKKLYDDNIYLNDSPEWWKYYDCTLVAPIRYYNKDRIKGKVDIDLDIIGFLCIDCKNNIKEWESSTSLELQLLAIVADSLYTYIRLFYNCFENVGYFNKENE